jgi:hypothetical protein
MYQIINAHNTCHKIKSIVVVGQLWIDIQIPPLVIS